jgi:hypothetical protein
MTKTRTRRVSGSRADFRPVEAASGGAGKPKRTLDARPDTLDFRDLMYVPTLTEVPLGIPLDRYREAQVPILDQGREGACTGFGLATVVHFLLRKRKEVPDPTPVSPRMLYEMAKRYDEWPGEEYDGSSARGCMKGWHKHGVCTAETWPYDPGTRDPHLTEPRSREAVQRPLGAYFRVNHRDLVAMHTALAEVGILYATAAVHSGWSQVEADGIIPHSPTIEGGHAFAIVAYDDTGFWIQNSWGPDWGRQGFGRISYDDWLQNGSDVWVGRLGVPIKLKSASSVATAREAAGGGRETYSVHDLRPHIIAIGNDGILRADGTYGTSAADVENLFKSDFRRITAHWKKRRILLYAHGGLVDETSAVQRLADYRAGLLEKEIYPVSFIWKSDFWTTVKNILEDAFRRRRQEGFLDSVKSFMLDRLDDALEPIARFIGGRMIWDEMKENAARATTLRGEVEGGARVAIRHLDALLQEFPRTELHVAAHSAGSIFMAPMVQAIASKEGLGKRIKTCTLWAPACTMELYEETYHGLIEAGLKDDKYGIGDFTVFALSDKAEQDDNCGGIYHKSLLYLVSNALEKSPRIPLLRPNGTPLLGMEKFAGAKSHSAFFKLVKAKTATLILSPNQDADSSGTATRATEHGAFDDDAMTVKSTLFRILGAPVKAAPAKFGRSRSSMADQMNALRRL